MARTDPKLAAVDLEEKPTPKPPEEAKVPDVATETRECPICKKAAPAGDMSCGGCGYVWGRGF